MNFNIRGENITITPALREYVEKKIGNIERYFDSTPTSDVRVNMSVYNDEQRIEVTIPMPNLLLRAEESHTDMYAAIDLVSNKLERQIRKHKTKVNRKFRQMDNAPSFVFTDNDKDADNGQDDEIEVVRTKRFDLKPMDAEEAILQMNMLGHNFFVFVNAETNQTNVVYARKDGKYGLIEAQ
ncbi:ribosome hibernation-promoting factor, HPF/YfiA family [Calidifontibacillus oryziterrae]|uniref:ribosome hibernation-promoting factor, HPF/YfiA family n=1 Tax=Calidifontibacillus oryziterrae TaxID=1191699 RepID=UPI0002FF7DA4|nr:ribosome-associated translation inhibitor RaiA [Calidifontibacillus oryziterrae]